MKVKFFFEALGTPKDFVSNFLQNLLNDLKTFEGIKIIKHEIAEPLEREIDVGNKKVKMWSSFLELETEVKDFQTLLDFVLMFNPSNIEILDIKKLEFTREELNTFLNTITTRLIQLTAIINDLNAKNQLLLQHLEKVAPRLAQQFKPKPRFNLKLGK